MHYLEKIFNLDQKVIIVTGGSRGIGFSLAKNLAMAGAIIVGIGRSKNIDYSFSDNAHYFECDLSNHEDFNSICKMVYKEFGSIYGLVNVAGISIENLDKKNNIKNFSDTVDFN